MIFEFNSTRNDSVAPSKCMNAKRKMTTNDISETETVGERERD